MGIEVKGMGRKRETMVEGMDVKGRGSEVMQKQTKGKGTNGWQWKVSEGI